MKYILIMLLFVSSVANAQTERGHYCSRKEADKLSNINNYYVDSLYATYIEDTVGITVTIINTTKDTIFIFSSYLQNQYLGSKYLHRIDLIKNQYKLSMLPIIPYVYTQYSDVIITTDEALMSNNQIVYDFIKIFPNSSIEIQFKYSELFKNKNQNNNVSRDYNVKILNKNSIVCKEFLTTRKLSGKYAFSFEFAVYNSVELLCNVTAYYMQEYAFDQESKNFKVLTVPVEVKKYNYHVLR